MDAQQIIARRRREKQLQLRRRRMIRIGASLIVIVVVVVLLSVYVVRPVANVITGSLQRSNSKSSATIETKADADTDIETAEAQEPEETPVPFTSEAARMPVKDQSNVSKSGVMTSGWQQDENGTWYQNPDGTFFTNGFMEIDGNTYYVDENGYVQTGWVEVDGVDYWFDENGVYDESVKRKMVALTFDDGPGEYTMDLLNFLEQYDAHVTFFVLGNNAQEYPEELNKMVSLGYEIGNHSYDHAQLSTLGEDQVYNEFSQTDDIIESACGVKPSIVRIPYGETSDTLFAAAGRPCIMWNIDTLDWSTLNADSTYNEVMQNITDGDIILMHDIHSPTVDAAKRIVPALLEQGYKLVTVSELATAKGVTMEPATLYTDFTAATVADILGTDISEVADSSVSSAETEAETAPETTTDETTSETTTETGTDSDTYYELEDSGVNLDSDSSYDSGYDSSYNSDSDSDYNSDSDSDSDWSSDSDPDSDYNSN